VALLLGAAASAGASDSDETAALFASGTSALRDGHAGDAIAFLEALADRGVVDAVASYDRGLAYALRVHIGAEVPGDLGRAAHGFEEARALSRDSRLAEDASRAIALIHSEVARRRVRAGESVQVDPGRSLARTVAGMLAEDAWSAIAAASSAMLAIGLFIRWLARAPRMRISGAVAAGVAVPLLAAAVAMTIAARRERTQLREAVVVLANARPADAHGLTTPGALPLPEGARVELLDGGGSVSHIRFGSLDAWVASNSIRELARAE
jgi:hypothetical protein